MVRFLPRRRWDPAEHPRSERTGRFVRRPHYAAAAGLLVLLMLLIAGLLAWATRDRGGSDNHPKPAPAVSDNYPTMPGAVPSSHLSPIPMPPTASPTSQTSLEPASRPTPSPSSPGLPICADRCG